MSKKKPVNSHLHCPPFFVRAPFAILTNLIRKGYSFVILSAMFSKVDHETADKTNVNFDNELHQLHTALVDCCSGACIQTKLYVLCTIVYPICEISELRTKSSYLLIIQYKIEWTLEPWQSFKHLTCAQVFFLSHVHVLHMYCSCDVYMYDNGSI